MAEDTQKPVEEETENKPAEEAEMAPEETPAEEADQAEAVTEPEEAPQEEESTADLAAEEVKDPYQDLKTGMVVRVHLKIKEITPKGDERERIQVFEGTIIAKKGQDKQSATITVRKVSGGIGVERIFPLKMPTIAKIETVKQLKVRRSKIYFIRDRRKKKLKEVSPKGGPAKK